MNDGTIFVEPAASLAETLAVALDRRPTARRVIVCGGRPGGPMLDDVRRWCEQSGEWTPLREPYVRGDALRATVAAFGREITITRAAPWFGESADPDACDAAVRIVRHFVNGWRGSQVKATPGHTGLAMLRAGGSLPELQSDDVRRLLRSTSGQGRFELFPRGRRAGRRLVRVDARFQYAALAAAAELPIGSPIDVTGEPDEYLRGWVEVDFAAPREWSHVGLLGVFDRDGDGWSYPLRGRTWCALSEVQLARRNGWRVRVLSGLVWPRKGRVLASWASHLIRERDHAERLPVPQSHRDAARVAMRAIVLQTVGMLHGGETVTQHVVDDARAIPDEAERIARTSDGRWQYETSSERDGHPELTTQLYALARVRLATQLLRQSPEQLVACALDGYFVAGDPVVDDDDGRAGRFRIADTYGRFPAFGTLADLYTHTKGNT